MSRANELCHTWMSHVTCERGWVMSHMNKTLDLRDAPLESSECVWVSSRRCPSLHYGAWVMSRVDESCHMWTSHVTCERVMSHVNESCHMWTSHVTCDIVQWRATKSRVSVESSQRCPSLSHVTECQVSVALHCTMVPEESHVWTSHVTCERVMSHVNESCHVWMSHGAYEWGWVMSHVNGTHRFSGLRLESKQSPTLHYGDLRRYGACLQTKTSQQQVTTTVTHSSSLASFEVIYIYIYIYIYISIYMCVCVCSVCI